MVQVTTDSPFVCDLCFCRRAQTIRTQAKEVETVQRQIQASLNRVHSTPAEHVPALVLSLAPLFEELRSKIRAVVDAVPDGQFWKVGLTHNDTS